MGIFDGCSAEDEAKMLQLEQALFSPPAEISHNVTPQPAVVRQQPTPTISFYPPYNVAQITPVTQTQQQKVAMNGQPAPLAVQEKQEYVVTEEPVCNDKLTC